MARKPTAEERKSTAFMRGYKEAARGKAKNNPFDDGLFREMYEKGYAAGKPSRGML